MDEIRQKAAARRKALRLGLERFPDADFVGMSRPMPLRARRAMIAPIRPDVRHHVRIVHSVFHRREQNDGRLAIRVRAFEKHDVDVEVVEELGRVRILRALSRPQAGAAQLVAQGARIIDVNAGLGRYGLQPKDRLERGKPLRRSARTILANDVA